MFAQTNKESPFAVDSVRSSPPSSPTSSLSKKFVSRSPFTLNDHEFKIKSDLNLRFLEVQNTELKKENDSLKEETCTLKTQVATLRAEIASLKECGVCLEQFSSGAHDPTVISCGHTLCRTCCDPLRNCPFCRKSISSTAPAWCLRELISPTAAPQNSEPLRRIVVDLRDQVAFATGQTESLKSALESAERQLEALQRENEGLKGLTPLKVENENLKAQLSAVQAVKECGVCYESYGAGNQDPTVMPCGHTICRACCNSVAQCPFCLKEISSVAPAFALRDLIFPGATPAPNPTNVSLRQLLQDKSKELDGTERELQVLKASLRLVTSERDEARRQALAATSRPTQMPRESSVQSFGFKPAPEPIKTEPQSMFSVQPPHFQPAPSLQGRSSNVQLREDLTMGAIISKLRTRFSDNQISMFAGYSGHNGSRDVQAMLGGRCRDYSSRLEQLRRYVREHGL
eukprot:c9160_g1_i1.p1 GENE.c9160_g1_i1~~c9160_g1_i1.p1  ORF type:complete len:468 (+),score=65.01 c9160_g1_i1:28-1404(+)